MTDISEKVDDVQIEPYNTIENELMVELISCGKTVSQEWTLGTKE